MKKFILIIISISFFSCQIISVFLSTNIETINVPDNMDSIRNFINQKLINEEKLKIVCWGDSITYGYKAYKGEQVTITYPLQLKKKLSEKFYEKVEVINEGKSGWTVEDAYKYLYQIIALKPDVVFIMFGINDEKKYNNTKYLDILSKIIEKLKDEKIEVCLLTPTPVLSRKNDGLIEKVKLLKGLSNEKKVNFLNTHYHVFNYIKYNNINFIDFFPDKTHFSDEYYFVIGDVLSEKILY